MTLSNHNSLNYHLEKIGLYYDPYCDLCTELQKGKNYYWQTNCLETASHILLECPHFSKLRYETYQKVKLTPKDIIKVKNPINTLTKFMLKTNIFERKPKLNKQLLSPNRIIKPNSRKRKSTTSIDQPNKKRITQKTLKDYISQ